MKTDRLTLLISPSDKEALSARAAELGITVSELMRRAAMDYDPDRDAHLAELGLLTTELSQAVERLRPKLDRAFAESERTRAEIAARTETAGRMHAALETDRAIDWPALAGLFGLARPANAAAPTRRRALAGRARA